jgi:hypothetical protein
MRRDTALALGLLAAGWAATLWLAPFDNERVNDFFVYRQLVEPLLDGALPYRDVFLEYPPLAAPAIGLPGLLGTGPEIFRAAFAGWTLLLAAATVLLIGALAAATGGDRRRALLAAAAMPLLCGAMVRTHFDLAPVAITLGALLLLCRDHPRAGLALLGAGAMTKGFPLLAAPPAIAWLVARGDRSGALQGAAAMVLTMGVIAAAALAVSPQGALDAVTYHLDRPVQVESAPASVLLGLDALGAGSEQAVSSHRSDGLAHPADGPVSAAFLLVMLTAVGLMTTLAARSAEPRHMVLAALTCIAAFAAFGRVLSPQYLIWTLPLLALALAWRMHGLAALLAAATLLTQLEFPARYFDVVEREPLALSLVAARNAVLALAVSLPAAAAARWLWPSRRRPPRSAPHSATDPLRRSRTSPG